MPLIKFIQVIKFIVAVIRISKFIACKLLILKISAESMEDFLTYETINKKNGDR